MADSDPQLDRIHAVLQEVGPISTESRAAILTGWCIVAEWMDENGERWLSKARAPSVSEWGASGMHHEALYGDGWGDDPDGGEA